MTLAPPSIPGPETLPAPPTLALPWNWLLLPQSRQVEVWQAGQGGSELLRQPARLDGSARHPDLVVSLEPFWTLCVDAQHG